MIEQVVDANIFIRWLVRGEPFSNKAKRLIRAAYSNNIQLIGPPLLEYEVESNLQRRLHSRRITMAEVDTALADFRATGIEFVSHPDMVRRAREIARQYRQERIYDALYVALAEVRGCELWTADRALYEAVRADSLFVNYLADYA